MVRVALVSLLLALSVVRMDAAPVGDDLATLTIDDVTVGENTKNAIVTVRVSAPGREVSFRYATRNDTATAGRYYDYTAVSGQATINASSTFALISVPIHLDWYPEDPETFFVILSDVTGATVGRDRAVVTILNEKPKMPTLTIANWSGSESSNATFVLRISRTVLADVFVDARTVGGTAKSGEDFYSRTVTVRIPAGQTSTTLVVDVIDDFEREKPEIFGVVLSKPWNAEPLNWSAVATIQDNDQSPAVAMTIEDGDLEEGHSGTAMLRARVSLNNVPVTPVTVRYKTGDGSATAGVDYTATQGALTFAAGEREQFISVPVHGDTKPEPDESFRLYLEADDVPLVRDRAICRIHDDDAAPLPTVSVRDASSVEGGGGVVMIMSVRVELSFASPEAVQVRYEAVNGTASAMWDFAPSAGTVTFAPGETETVIRIPIIADEHTEPDETFLVNLSDPQGATIEAGTAVCTIENDDAAARSRRRTARH